MKKIYFRFLLSCLLAFTAGHMVNYSVILYAQDALKSTLISGLGFGLCFGPPLILGWFAGVACDRLPPSRVIHAATGAFLFATLLFLAMRHGDNMTQRALLLFGAFTAGVGWSFVSPARMAMVPQVFRPEHLKSAYLVFNILVMLGFGLGPIFISLLRTHIGWGGVFSGAFTFFSLSSLLLLGIPSQAGNREPESVFHSVRTGLNAVRGNFLLRDLLFCAIFGFMLMGPIQVIVPKLALEHFGMSETERGSFLGMLAPSFILGGVLCMLLIRRVRNAVLIFGSIILAGISFASLSQIQQPKFALFLLVLVGTLGGLAMSSISALIQERVDPLVRGRVLSMYTIISQVMPAISGVLAGVIVHFFGVTRAGTFCGAFLSLSALLNIFWMRALRSYVDNERSKMLQ